MLKYLWMVTQDLLISVTLVTLMHAVLDRRCGARGRKIHFAGILVGTLAAIGFAVGRFTTNKIIPSHWNHYIYALTILFFLAVLVLYCLFGRQENGRWHAGSIALALCGACLSAIHIFYFLPSVLLYPFSFNTMGNGVWSSYYMVRIAGWLVALILLYVYSRLLYRCSLHIRSYRLVSSAMLLGSLIHVVYCFGRFFVPWVNRAKWLNWPVKYSDAAYGWIGSWMMFTANHSMLFIWLVAVLAAALLVIAFAENTRVTEPWENVAQRRKLRARCRKYRRMAAAGLVGLVLFTLILTAVKSYDTRVIALSAPETYTVEDDQILVPLEAVNDGHLHRFEYRTENDVDIRWIVIRKPNSASYGVGFDACDVCGDAGYYERGDQVVCKRCDVVMNINTIGFKGGCNPVPLDYAVGDGYLVFKLEDLLAGERRFK